MHASDREDRQSSSLIGLIKFRSTLIIACREARGVHEVNKEQVSRSVGKKRSGYLELLGSAHLPPLDMTQFMLHSPEMAATSGSSE